MWSFNNSITLFIEPLSQTYVLPTQKGVIFGNYDSWIDKMFSNSAIILAITFYMHFSNIKLDHD